MNKTSLFTLSILSLAVLSACDSGSASQPSANLSSGTMSLDIPASLTSRESALDSAGEAGASQISELLVSETVSAVESSIESTGSNSLPLDMLIVDSSLLLSRVDLARYELDLLRNVMGGVVEHCATAADGVECDLPLSLMADMGAVAVDESIDTDLGLDIHVLEGDTVATDVDTSNTTYLESASYIRNPAGEHDHVLELKNNYGNGEASAELYRWDQAYENIRVTAAGSWAEGQYENELAYQASDAGNTVALLEKSTHGTDEYTSLYQLRELNDGNNGAEIQSKATWKNDSETGQVVSSAAVNNDGGAMTSTSTIQAGGATFITHSRSNFDKNGSVLKGEYCIESGGVDCEESGNWQAYDVDSGVSISPVDIVSEMSQIDASMPPVSIESEMLQIGGETPILIEGETSTGIEGEMPVYQYMPDIEIDLYTDFEDGELFKEMLEECRKDDIPAENCFIIE